MLSPGTLVCDRDYDFDLPLPMWKRPKPFTVACGEFVFGIVITCKPFVRHVGRFSEERIDMVMVLDSRSARVGWVKERDIEVLHGSRNT